MIFATVKNFNIAELGVMQPTTPSEPEGTTMGFTKTILRTTVLSSMLALSGLSTVNAGSGSCPYPTDLTSIETSGLFSPEQIQKFENDLQMKGYISKKTDAERYLHIAPKLSRSARPAHRATVDRTIFGVQIIIKDSVLAKNAANQKRPAIYIDTEVLDNQTEKNSQASASISAAASIPSSPLDLAIPRLIKKIPTCHEAAQQLDYLDMTTPKSESSWLK